MYQSLIVFPKRCCKLQLFASSEEQLCKASPAYPLAHLQPWLVFWYPRHQGLGSWRGCFQATKTSKKNAVILSHTVQNCMEISHSWQKRMGSVTVSVERLMIKGLPTNSVHQRVGCHAYGHHIRTFAMHTARCHVRWHEAGVRVVLSRRKQMLRLPL